MDPKRKKIYIALIIVCVLISAGVLLWGSGGTPTNTSFNRASTLGVPTAGLPTTGNVPAAVATQPRTLGSDITYTAPQVFPASKSLDIPVLKSIQNLQSYQAVQLLPQELGRDNPLDSY